MNTDFIKLTRHAKERALKRYLMQPAEIRELAYKAITDGFGVGDAPNKDIRNYMKRKQNKKTKFYIYGGYGFIFDVTSTVIVVVTTFKLEAHVLNRFNKANDFSN